MAKIKQLLRKVKRLILKNRIKKHEKLFDRLSYCFFPCEKSKTLIVVFSAFPGKDCPPVYNYLTTLSGIKANKLFLLDDVWNPVNVGSYYLGKDGDWYLEQDVLDLLQKIKAEHAYDKVITVGSSKGGTSALYFGIKTEADTCIIGAPQYHVGSYLSSEHSRPILKVIMGDSSQSSIDKLNSYIVDEMRKDHSKKSTIYIHYSPKEHTYKDHIKDMIADLHENGYQVIEDNAYDYEQHSDVAKHFPAYLVSTVKREIQD
jgi:hypothetical protein